MNPVSDIIHPALAASAAAAAARASHRDAGVAATGERIFAAGEDGVVLSLRLGALPHQAVQNARYNGATDPDLMGILETFCRAIEELPLREAADHGTVHALERLRANGPTRAVAGILTPRSAGSGFVLCDRLIRRILAEHGSAESRSTANFWNPPLSETWRAQSAEDRRAALESVAATFRSAWQLSLSEFYLASIDRNIRVLVGFGSGVSPERKPGLLREFEGQIRRLTGSRLEVYVEEMKDHNAIRRL